MPESYAAPELPQPQIEIFLPSSPRRKDPWHLSGLALKLLSVGCSSWELGLFEFSLRADVGVIKLSIKYVKLVYEFLWKNSSYAKMLLTLCAYASLTTSFNLMILTRIISFSFRFLKMLRPWEVFLPYAIIVESSFPIILKLQNLYKGCSWNILVGIGGRMRSNLLKVLTNFCL